MKHVKVKTEKFHDFQMLLKKSEAEMFSAIDHLKITTTNFKDFLNVAYTSELCIDNEITTVDIETVKQQFIDNLYFFTEGPQILQNISYLKLCINVINSEKSRFPTLITQMAIRIQNTQQYEIGKRNQEVIYHALFDAINLPKTILLEILECKLIISIIDKDFKLWVHAKINNPHILIDDIDIDTDKKRCRTFSL